MNQEMERTIFAIIAQAGEARAQAYSALDSLRRKDFAEARRSIEQARSILGDIHKTHADLVMREARGEDLNISLLLIHAEDILMAASSETALVERIIEIVAEIAK
ncbi:MAG TPA: PTS lactose/cellobiose transporter subunit IIA [Firmicutes bacterium]|nr:PTS lactose/cellobiose transporter subunit IIA [Candidatus Fermentithermobacillaceae bacterium]